MPFDSVDVCRIFMLCGLLWFFEGGKAAGAEVKAMPSVQLCAHKR